MTNFSGASGYRRLRSGARQLAICLVTGACLALAAYGEDLSGQPALSPELGALVKSARLAGAASLVATPTEDGGLRLNGELQGRPFSLAIPPHWNKQAVLVAHGYTQARKPETIEQNPLENDPTGTFRTPYSEGFAVGQSAYDKTGLAVESGVKNTDRLKKLVDALGTTRTYLIGISMGGDITVASIEKHPDAYAGAIAACGVVGGWHEELGWMMDVRAAYNYFTKGTPYELPGDKDLTKSALPAPPADASGVPSPAAVKAQNVQIGTPIVMLFAAARANPGGPEDRMIANIAAVGGTQKDISAFALPLVIVTLGEDDIRAVHGGIAYDNSQKVYKSPFLSAAENEALNRGIQRVHADPAAVAKAKAWYTPTGRFKTKLLSLYNAIDPLVPSGPQESILKEAVTKAGNTANLVQRSVPEMRTDFVGTGIVGSVHCGFTPEQVKSAFDDLRSWVETDNKP